MIGRRKGVNKWGSGGRGGGISGDGLTQCRHTLALKVNTDQSHPDRSKANRTPTNFPVLPHMLGRFDGRRVAFRVANERERGTKDGNGAQKASA